MAYFSSFFPLSIIAASPPEAMGIANKAPAAMLCNQNPGGWNIRLVMPDDALSDRDEGRGLHVRVYPKLCSFSYYYLGGWIKVEHDVCMNVKWPGGARFCRFSGKGEDGKAAKGGKTRRSVGGIERRPPQKRNAHAPKDKKVSMGFRICL